MQPRVLTPHWRLKAAIEEVAEVLGNVEHLPDWRGYMYLPVQVTDRGDENGLGRKIAVHSRGRLPDTLCWQDMIFEQNWAILAKDDLRGQGVWTLKQDG